MAATCIFCQIAAGEIPSTEVASSKLSYAFRDLDAKAPTHVLVVPREHVANAGELGAHHGELLADLYQVAQEVARAEGIDQTGYRLIMNVGDDAGNTVPHLHLHIMGGRKMSWPAG
jgi:histidine triad (HIT) family protein